MWLTNKWHHLRQFIRFHSAPSGATNGLINVFHIYIIVVLPSACKQTLMCKIGGFPILRTWGLCAERELTCNIHPFVKTVLYSPRLLISHFGFCSYFLSSCPSISGCHYWASTVLRSSRYRIFISIVLCVSNTSSGSEEKAQSGNSSCNLDILESLFFSFFQT